MSSFKKVIFHLIKTKFFLSMRTIISLFQSKSHKEILATALLSALISVKLSWVAEMSWRGEWQSTLVSLPGESHGPRSLVSYSPWSHKQLDTTEQLTHSIVTTVLLNNRRASVKEGSDRIIHIPITFSHIHSSPLLVKGRKKIQHSKLLCQ